MLNQRMKKEIRLFTGSFLITLILFGTAVGFSLVDKSTSRYGFGNIKPMVDVQKSGEMTYDTTFFGNDYIVTLDPINTLQKYRKQYSAFLVPRSVRLTELAVELSKAGLEKARKAYLEYQFIQNTK